MSLSVWIVLVLLTILILTVVWLLWGKIIICIDTYRNRYYFSFGGLLRVEPILKEGSILVKVIMPFYNFQVDPTKGFNNSKNKVKRARSPKRKEKSDGRRIGLKFYLQLVIDVLKTFTIKKFSIDLDTNDFVLNAKLTPIMVALNRGVADIKVNYLGLNGLRIIIENQLVKFVPLAFRFIRIKYL